MVAMLIIALALTGCGAENENANTEEDTNAGNDAVEIISEEAPSEEGFDFDDSSMEDEDVDTDADAELLSEYTDDGGADAGLLPAYTYDGDADIAAICDYLTNVVASGYEDADVSIPYMSIVDKDDTDPEDTLVWGDFWVMNYNLNGEILETESGGNYPGLMHLKKNDDESYEVTDFEVIEDGSGFIESAKRIFGDRYDDFTKAQSDDKTGDIVIDAEKLEYISSAGLRVLMKLRKSIISLCRSSMFPVMFMTYSRQRASRSCSM